MSVYTVTTGKIQHTDVDFIKLKKRPTVIVWADNNADKDNGLQRWEGARNLGWIIKELNTREEDKDHHKAGNKAGMGENLRNRLGKDCQGANQVTTAHKMRSSAQSFQFNQLIDLDMIGILNFEFYILISLWLASVWNVIWIRRPENSLTKKMSNS